MGIFLGIFQTRLVSIRKLKITTARLLGILTTTILVFAVLLVGSFLAESGQILGSLVTLVVILGHRVWSILDGWIAIPAKPRRLANWKGTYLYSMFLVEFVALFTTPSALCLDSYEKYLLVLWIINLVPGLLWAPILWDSHMRPDLHSQEAISSTTELVSMRDRTLEAGSPTEVHDGMWTEDEDDEEEDEQERQRDRLMRAHRRLKIRMKPTEVLRYVPRRYRRLHSVA